MKQARALTITDGRSCARRRSRAARSAASTAAIDAIGELEVRKPATRWSTRKGAAGRAGHRRSRRLRDRQAGVPFRRDHPRGADARPVAGARRSGHRPLRRADRQARLLGPPARRGDQAVSTARDLAEMALMRDAGARAVATGRRWIADSGVMLRLLRLCRRCSTWSWSSHAEDDGAHRRRRRDRGRDGDAARPALRARRRRGAGDRARPRAGRDDRRAAALPPGDDRRGLRSGPRRQARAASPSPAGSRRRISCSPTSRSSDFRTFARLSPPLRAEADRQAVLAAIADGTIDVLASGHDPRGPEDKRLPFADADAGHGRRRDAARAGAEAGARRSDRARARCSTCSPPIRRGCWGWIPARSQSARRPICCCSIRKRRGRSTPIG